MLVSATVRTLSVSRWMVTDHLGTPRIVADRTGSLSAIKRHDYLPFGEEIGPSIGDRSWLGGYSSTPTESTNNSPATNATSKSEW